MITYPQWFAAMAPYAERVHAATGVLTGVVLAVMAEESFYGSSQLAKENNMSGIRYVGQAQASGHDGGFATYASLDQWASDMARVLSLPNYAGVRSAQGATAQIRAFGQSGYDAGSFSELQAYTNTLLEVYGEQGLAAYDGAQPGYPSPQPAAPTYAAMDFNVTSSGNQVTIATPAPAKGAGPGFGLALFIALAMWAAANL